MNGSYTVTVSQFQIFTTNEQKSLRIGGKILKECLAHIATLAKPGVKTIELDRAAEEFIRSRGGEPAFKGYHGYSSTLCTSINEQCVHGIPSERTLKDGDIVGLDCGVIYDGLYTDSAVTVAIGNVPASTKKFLDVTKEALEEACKLVKPGIRIGVLSSTIQQIVEVGGYKPMRALTGHGLGKTLHQFPDIYNFGEPSDGPILPPWTLIAIEPITSMGSDRIKEEKDGWTISTSDGALSAHYEHTVLVTENGHEIIA